MRGGVLLLLVPVLACNDAPPSAAVAPPPTLGAALAAAGQEPTKLCALVREHGGTAEAQQALERMRALHAQALPRIAAEMERRGTHPAIRRALDAVVQGGAAAPCERLVTVHVERELSGGPGWEDYLGGSTVTFDSLVRNTPAWPDQRATGDAIARAIGELGGGWLSAVFWGGAPGTMAGPRLVVTMTAVSDGTVALGDAYTMPKLAIDTRVDTLVAPGAEEHVQLPRARFRVGGTVTYSERQGTVLRQGNAGQLTVDRMLHDIGAAMTPVPQQLGLLEAEPGLVPWQGRHTVMASPATDTCGGRIGWGAPAFTIHAGRRVLEAEGVDRTYRARADGDTLVAEGEFDAEGMCAGTQLEERWELRRTPDGHAQGALTSTWRLDPSCDRPCTARFELVVQ